MSDRRPQFVPGVFRYLCPELPKKCPVCNTGLCGVVIRAHSPFNCHMANGHFYWSAWEYPPMAPVNQSLLDAQIGMDVLDHNMPAGTSSGTRIYNSQGGKKMTPTGRWSGNKTPNFTSAKVWCPECGLFSKEYTEAAYVLLTCGPVPCVAIGPLDDPNLTEEMVEDVAAKVKVYEDEARKLWGLEEFHRLWYAQYWIPQKDEVQFGAERFPIAPVCAMSDDAFLIFADWLGDHDLPELAEALRRAHENDKTNGAAEWRHDNSGSAEFGRVSDPDDDELNRRMAKGAEGFDGTDS